MGQTRQEDLIVRKVVGHHIMGLRISKKITRKMLTARTGLSECKIYNVEKGKCDPSLDTIVAIAIGLDLHPMELFDFNFDFL